MGQPSEEVIVPLGRHGLAPDVVAAHQRERLFAATVDLVAKRGYRNTSIDHIVKAARVGYVAFYDLFEGKEDCFLAAFDRIAAETGEALAAAVAQEDEWPRQIAAALSCVLGLIAADPKRARVGLVEVQAAGPAAYARYEEAVDRAVPKLREGRAFNPDTSGLSPTLEEAVLGGIIWVIHQRLVKGELRQPEPLLEETVQIALSPYLGDLEARQVAEAAMREVPASA
jgi:AcrR family transcriptional regulator